jgi:hypothetical protein
MITAKINETTDFVDNFKRIKKFILDDSPR